MMRVPTGERRIPRPRRRHVDPKYLDCPDDSEHADAVCCRDEDADGIDDNGNPECDSGDTGG
jgi:hypothetical protein